MEHLAAAPLVPVRKATGQDWISADHTAEPVLALLDSLGWSAVSTPEANVHCTSPDGHAYVGWLPEDPTAWERGIVFRVRVTPTDGGTPWEQEFNTDTPAVAVAGFLSGLASAPVRPAS
ncbi:DUF317 domain-containing protein [Streptomyces himalayensis]|uniref:DUF317 domain-containing protein n=1 Tax=Streptomyces himalayensis TaxID=2820085 RepID=UPI0028A7091F|nr:DUF317 domain-containing protein [Streptomyces himalayensis]